MHRVELKELTEANRELINHVPNAPCGVESGYEDRFVWEFVASS